MSNELWSIWTFFFLETHHENWVHIKQECVYLRNDLTNVTKLIDKSTVEKLVVQFLGPAINESSQPSENVWNSVPFGTGKP